MLSSQNRTKRAFQNVGISMVIKGGSILISFLLVPITLDYLNPYEYGVWITLNSILSWVYLFDIGLGNGLRNKLAEALAAKNYKLGKTYVSTTYFSMSVIIAIILLLFLIAQHWLNWDDILNVIPGKVPHLNMLVTIVFSFFCLSFVFRLIGNVFMALQLSFVNDGIAFCGNIFALIIIYICTKYLPSSLLLVVCVLAGAPLLVYVIMTPIAYCKYRNIAPGLKYIKLEYFRSLLTLGVKFMAIQVASLILFMTSNLIISQLFGPQDVTPYNIAFKLFSIISTAFTIIITPFWSAITDAYTKNEYDWIKKSNRRILKIWMLCVAGTFGILFLSPYIYIIWIGDTVSIPFSLSLMCAIYVTLTNWNNIWAFTINGTGKLYVSLLLAVLQAVIYIPLSIFLAKIYGVIGIVIGLCICMLISSVISPLQYRKLFYENSGGIWAK